MWNMDEREVNKKVGVKEKFCQVDCEKRDDLIGGRTRKGKKKDVGLVPASDKGGKGKTIAARTYIMDLSVANRCEGKK